MVVEDYIIKNPKQILEEAMKKTFSPRILPFDDDMKA